MAKIRPKYKRGTYILHRQNKWLARVLQNRWLEQKYLLEPLNFNATETFKHDGMSNGMEFAKGPYQLHGPALASRDYMFRATIQLINSDWIGVDAKAAKALYAKKG